MVVAEEKTEAHDLDAIVVPLVAMFSSSVVPYVTNPKSCRLLGF